MSLHRLFVHRSGDRSSRAITKALQGLLVSAATLLAVAPGARAQTLGPELVRQLALIEAEKAQRTPAQRKLDSQLIFALKQRRNDPVMADMPRLRIGVEMRGDGATLVDLRGTVTPALVRAIARAGGTVVSSHSELGALRAWVPVLRLESLAARPDVRWIEPPALIETSVTTMGDSDHLANFARGLFAADGSGVKICAISDGVANLASVQELGELPAVDVLPGQEGSGSEGTALLEIINDLAPGAALGFASASGGLIQFSINVRNLRFQAGCDVIVDDVGIDLSPSFQDGDIARAVNDVTANGAIYLTSAGNSGGLGRNSPAALPGSAAAYENDFRGVITDVGQGPVLANDFGGGVTLNRIAEDATSFVLEWSDAQLRSGNDYDLFMLVRNPDGTLSIDAMSNSNQTGTQSPRERIRSPMTDDDTGKLLMVTRRDGSQDRFIRLAAFGTGVRGLRGRLAIGTVGAIAGHQGANSAITVAAARASGDLNMPFPTRTIEPFSSQGPRRIFFTPDGTPLTPGNFSSTGGLVLPKPDVVGADGVATRTFDNPNTPANELFFGTSAAAPHIAAIVGLALSAVPDDASDAVRQRLRQNMKEILRRTALPLEAGPLDMGAGTVNALAVVQLGQLGLPCLDDLDNDGDGVADAADPGCAGLIAITEAPPCSDGVDNDEDGLLDAVDADCEAPSDGTECGSGGIQSMAILPLLAHLGRRRKRSGAQDVEQA